MMKRILNLMSQDLTLILRDSIVIYIIIGPILLALALRMFLPSVEDIKLTFAVDKNISEKHMTELQKYGVLEVYDNAQEVRKRVEGTDAVPGVVNENGKITVIFEGNEPESVIENYKTILEQVLFGNGRAQFTHKSIGAEKSTLYEIMTILIIITAIFLSGVAPGFNIVGEKDTGAIKALSISPMRFQEYIAARGLLSFIISIFIVLVSSLIMVEQLIQFWKLLVLLLFSFSLTTIVSMVIGRLANNQISAISAIKIIMPVYLTLPLASIFVPNKFQFFLYPLPNYWQFQALLSIYSNMGSTFGFWTSTMLTFITGTVYLILFTRIFKKNFGIR